jgi:nucleoside-diphosphate-sugar epimerase
MKYRVAIIGGAGYIGSSLARYFAKDLDVKVLDRAPLPEDLEGKVSYARCDVREYEEIVAEIDDADLVMDTAIVQIPLINEQKRLGYEVNVLGTQNICRAVDESARAKGMILAGSWHAVGERELMGVIDEEFGFRPDKVEDRARLYALAKIAQESVVRFYDEMSEKVFGIIRMGTVLGEGMPEKTAANIFIENGIKGKPLTPFKHSMFRPMLYVDVDDVCKAYENFVRKILNGEFDEEGNSLAHIFNVYYPEPVTILELAEIVRDAIVKHSDDKISPKIEVVDTGQPSMFDEEDKKRIRVDVSKVMSRLGLGRLKNPRSALERIVEVRMKQRKLVGRLCPKKH